MKRFFTALLATWWASPLCLLACTLLSAASMAGWILTAQRPAAATLNGVLRVAPSFLLPAAAVFGLLSLAVLIGALCKKRWRRALGTFLAGGAACGIGLAALMAVVMLRFFWDDDHTADDWSVPEGLEVAVPGKASWPDDPPQSGNDPYRNAVMAALSQEGTDDATLTATAPSLARLAAEHPDLLKRYFTLHPAWRVFPDRGGLRATRVMGQDGRWPYPLNGYFSQLFAPDGMRWQVRLSVILEGNGWFWPRGATQMKEGETREIALTGNQVKESYTEIEAGGMRLEIFEQSERNERRLTKALLRLLEEELQPLAASPTEETLRTLLPPGSIVGGEAGIDLRDGSQGGIYEGYFRANPGEPGLAWLKAYEVTTETPLSERRLAEDSAVRLGWSDDPAELFPGSVHFTIYEGNWDHYYAARFELWFRPDATGEARKLAEKTYKIQGWMR